METLGRRPIALILPGGAALGAWQGGCLYALARAGLTFSTVIGTSAGTLNGCAYLQDSLEEMRRIWRDIRRSEFVALRPRLSPPSLYSQERLRAFLGRFVDEDKARRAKRCWLSVVSTDLAKGESHRADFSPEPGGPWDGPLLDHVLGSISVPFLWPPVVVGPREAPRLILVDGHVSPQLDLAPAFARGARDFLFLSVLHPSEYGSLGLTANGYVRTLINQLLKGQLQDGLRGLAGHGAGVRAFVFHPDAPLGVKPFAFETGPCREAFDRGTADAGRLLASPTTYRAL